MKKFVSLMLLLCACVILRSQNGLEIGIQGMQQLNSYKLKNTGNTLNSDGYSCGIRLGIGAGKNLFQTSVLYSHAHVPAVSSSNKEHPVTNELPSKTGIAVVMMARHHFKPAKKVCTFLAAGASAVVFSRTVHYNSSAGPVFPGNSQADRYNVAAVFSPGIRCRIDEKLSLDIETGVNYYFLENTFYKHNVALNIGFTFNYRFSSRQIASSDQ